MKDEKVNIVYEFDFMIFQDLTDEQRRIMGWDATRVPLQKIYISADKTKLLEIVNNSAAYLY